MAGRGLLENFQLFRCPFLVHSFIHAYRWIHIILSAYVQAETFPFSMRGDFLAGVWWEFLQVRDARASACMCVYSSFILYHWGEFSWEDADHYILGEEESIDGWIAVNVVGFGLGWVASLLRERYARF